MIELVDKILEYKKFKEASAKMADMGSLENVNGKKRQLAKRVK